VPEKSFKKLDSLKEQFVTVSEAAELRGVSRASIHALIMRDRLKAVEMFGRVLLYRREVEGFEKEKPGPKSTGRRK
jgi:excisionase family DNA binding protein